MVTDVLILCVGSNEMDFYLQACTAHEVDA